MGYEGRAYKEKYSVDNISDMPGEACERTEQLTDDNVVQVAVVPMYTQCQRDNTEDYDDGRHSIQLDLHTHTDRWTGWKHNTLSVCQ